MSSNSDSPGYMNRFAAETGAHSVPRPVCRCLSPQYHGQLKWRELQLHSELQDTKCAGWRALLELIDEAARDGREEFAPGRAMAPELWAQITTLPAEIAKLTAVKHLNLYGSSLVRIPPEIGELTNLETFTPYTSYRLHWFPYEITRCTKLKDSTVSTRALYGNYKYRPPFPRLPQHADLLAPAKCSICETPLVAMQPKQFWISLRVATDVLPLLIHACSHACLARVASPPNDYVPQPHRGGLGLAQPQTR